MASAPCGARLRLLFLCSRAREWLRLVVCPETELTRVRIELHGRYGPLMLSCNGNKNSRPAVALVGWPNGCRELSRLTSAPQMPKEECGKRIGHLGNSCQSRRRHSTITGGKTRTEPPN
jgi:hypothetical protein